jgi:hypothetical protein
VIGILGAVIFVEGAPEVVTTVVVEAVMGDGVVDATKDRDAGVVEAVDEDQEIYGSHQRAEISVRE